MNKKLRIVLFLPGFGNGGAERVFIRLYNFLHSKGHDVDLLVAAKKGDLVGKLDKNVTYLKSKYALSSFISYTAYIRRAKPDIVIATLSGAIIISGLTKILRVSPKHQLIHRVANIYQPPRSFFEKIRLLAEKISINASNAIIANSEATLRSIDDFFKTNQNIPKKIISNPVLDDDFHTNFSKKKNIYNEGGEVVIIGRFVAQKQISHAIEAFSLVALDINDAKLIIVGDGPEKDSLESKVIKLRLEDKVIFQSYCDDIPSLLTKSSSLINTSLFEGFGNIFIEGLAYAKNLIVYESPGGASELLKATNAVIIEQGNIKLLAKAIKSSLETSIKKDNRPLADFEFLNQYTESFIGNKYETFFLYLIDKE